LLRPLAPIRIADGTVAFPAVLGVGLWRTRTHGFRSLVGPMTRHFMRMMLSAAMLFQLALPAASKAVHPAPYRVHPLKGDAFTARTILESEFGGDYARVAFVPVAESDQAAEPLLAAIPAPAQQELTFENGGRTLKYLAVGDISKPAKM